MKIVVCETEKEVSKIAADIIIAKMKFNNSLNLGLATGSSQLGLYQVLVRVFEKGVISFEKVKTFNLDEYLDIERSHPQSFYSFMDANLFKHVNIKKENIYIPNSKLAKSASSVAWYNDMLSENPIDIQMLGIGRNGHIGFNEPGTSFDKEVFVAKLTQETRIDNASGFGCVSQVPKYAITMGIKNIMSAKKIVLIVTGIHKAKIIEQMINGKINDKIPASILKTHQDCLVILDKDAASLLKKGEEQK